MSKKYNHQEVLQASDFNNLLCTLRIVQDRALAGTPLHVRRPEWYPKAADPIAAMRASVAKMLEDIFATAVTDEPEEEST